VGEEGGRRTITENPAAKAKPPRLDLEEEDEIEPNSA
jgi:hypothetical protein